MFFISTVFSFWGMLKISKLFFLNNFFSLLLILLYVLNIDQIDVGGYDLIRTTFYPGLIGMPILLFTIYYFLKNQYNIMFVLLSLLFWVHLPTAFPFLAIFFCFFMGRGQYKELSKYVIGITFFIISLCLYMFLVHRQMVLSMGNNLPDWCDYLGKMVTYGHISAYYLFQNIGILEMQEY